MREEPSASLAALRANLAWAAEQGMSIRGQLDPRELEALAGVFAGHAPWDFALYEPLRAFAHALPRLALPDLPAPLTFGDVLLAIDELRAETTPAWPTSPGVGARTRAALGYAGASAGITRLHEAHPRPWREHGRDNKAFLVRAAEVATVSSVAVVGAGKLYDIPLAELVARFSRVVLIDVDGEALEQSVSEAELAPGARARVELVCADVTGINDTFLVGAEEVFACADEDEVVARLLAFLHRYRIAAPPRLFSEELGAVDVACSSMVLSQLAIPLNRHLEGRFQERFPQSQRFASPPVQVALGQFTQRLQLAHLRALLAAAPRAVLTTDVAETFTAVDPQGNVVRTSARLSLIGAPLLADLVPAHGMRASSTASWTWRRVVPTPARPHGCTLDVEGVVLDRV